MNLRSASLAFLVVVVASLSGCGEDGAVEQITDLTKQFAADVRAKDWNAVCDAMATKAKAEVEAGAVFVGVSGCPALRHAREDGEWKLDSSP